MKTSFQPFVIVSLALGLILTACLSKPIQDNQVEKAKGDSIKNISQMIDCTMLKYSIGIADNQVDSTTNDSVMVKILHLKNQVSNLVEEYKSLKLENTSLKSDLKDLSASPEKVKR